MMTTVTVVVVGRSCSELLSSRPSRPPRVLLASSRCLLSDSSVTSLPFPMSLCMRIYIMCVCVCYPCASRLEGYINLTLRFCAGNVRHRLQRQVATDGQPGGPQGDSTGARRRRSLYRHTRGFPTQRLASRQYRWAIVFSILFYSILFSSLSSSSSLYISLRL